MFRFTIRDVLWLTVVVAMGAALWLESLNRGPENARLRRENAQLQKQLNSRDLTPPKIEPTRQYLAKLTTRMQRRGFAAGDPLWLRALAAENRAEQRDRGPATENEPIVNIGTLFAV